MNYKYYTADVFTDKMFGGNQLAVFPQAEGLTPQQMQQIAAEFNFSETVFVFPPQTAKGTQKLRIFTPKTELPFAGHPTVGTAYVLAAIGEVPFQGEETTVYFEEGVGIVPVKIRTRDGKPYYSELTAAKLPEFGSQIPSIADLAAMLSLETTDLLTDENSPQVVSCGVPFLFIPVRNREILGKARLDRQWWEAILSNHIAPSVFIFCFDPELEGSNIRARMFAPAIGVEEDPATGSAAAALAGYLGVRQACNDLTIRWIVEQGFEMGRPSILMIEADKKNGQIVEIRVGGSSVLVCQGTIEIG